MLCSRLTSLSRHLASFACGSARSSRAFSNTSSTWNAVSKIVHSVALVKVNDTTKALCLRPASNNLPLSKLTPISNFPRWIPSCFRAHLELLWFVEGPRQKVHIPGLSYSEQIFGHDYAELDHTLHSVRKMQLIVEGGEAAYLEFTAEQAEDHRLSRQSFLTLVVIAKQLLAAHVTKLSESDIISAIETALILKNMGKSEQAREMFHPYGVTASDPKIFCREATKVLCHFPHLVPSFNKLSDEGKRLVVISAHLTSVEGTAMINRNASIARWGLYFDFLAHVCSMVGRSAEGRMMSLYHEPAHQSTLVMRKAARAFAESYQIRDQAHRNYLDGHFALSQGK